MKALEKLARSLLLQKASKIADACETHVAGRVLDLGAGRCYIGRELQRRRPVSVISADIANLNQTDLPYVIYDGVNVPFHDQSFDTVLLVYVLHHCNRPVKVLREAMRVCRGKIILFEDDESILRKPQDFIYNQLHGVATPFNFKSSREWLDIFEALDVKVAAVVHGVEKEWFYPFVPHTMYVLNVGRRPDPTP